MKLWLNGALQEAETARLDPADRGLMLGDGIFETIRVSAGQPEHLPAHLDRLQDGAACLDIALPEITWLGQAIPALLAANELADAVLRLTVTRGPAVRGILPVRGAAPTLLMTAAPLPPALPPARMIISRRTRRNEWSPLSRIKSLNYGDNILARAEAEQAGADDAVMLNSRGMAAGATSANLFIVTGGRTITPPVADGALPGIMRGVLMAQLQVLEASLSVDDLHAADEMFMSNALGLRQVSQLEGKHYRIPPFAE